MEVKRSRIKTEPKKHRRNIFHYAAPLVAAIGIGVITWQGIAQDTREVLPTPSAQVEKKENGQENKKTQLTKKQKETFRRLLLLAKILKENEGNREQDEGNVPQYGSEERAAGKDNEQEVQNDEESEVQPLKPVPRENRGFAAEDSEKASETDNEPDSEPIAEGQESEADDEVDFSWPERDVTEGQVFGRGVADISIDYEEYNGPSKVTGIFWDGVELEVVGENEPQKVKIGYGEPFYLSLEFVTEMAGYTRFPMEFVKSDTGVKMVPSCKGGTVHFAVFSGSETWGEKYPFCD